MKLINKLKSLFGTKKGVAGLDVNATSFGVTVAIVAVLAIFLTALQDSQTASSFAANITGDGLTGLSNISAQFGLLGTILILVVVILFVRQLSSRS